MSCKLYKAVIIHTHNYYECELKLNVTALNGKHIILLADVLTKG